jgi:hypothetical protein
MTHHARSDGNPAELTYQNRPDINETYVDTLETIVFDGSAIRMEFVVHRFDPPRSGGAPSGCRVTASRLVLPLGAAMNLQSQLSSMLSAAAEEGSTGGVMLMQSQHGYVERH